MEKRNKNVYRKEMMFGFLNGAMAPATQRFLTYETSHERGSLRQGDVYWRIGTKRKSPQGIPYRWYFQE